MTQAAAWNGPVSINGMFDVWGNQDPNNPFTFRWDCDIDFRDASFSQGINIKHLDGAVRLIGQTDGRILRVQGQLKAESAVVRDMQLTDIEGPIWIDERQIVLGDIQTFLVKNGQPL